MLWSVGGFVGDGLVAEGREVWLFTSSVSEMCAFVCLKSAPQFLRSCGKGEGGGGGGGEEKRGRGRDPVVLSVAGQVARERCAEATEPGGP